MPVPLGEQIHDFVPSDQVWVKDGKHDCLAPPLEGSMYCLPTPMAVRVADVTPWIHHMSVKTAYHADPEDTSGHKGPH